MNLSAHFLHSSYREMLLEHLFVGEVLKHLWKNGIYHAELLKPQVDDSGYDIVITCNSITRYIQLKGAHEKARRANVNVQLALAEKPNGCVIWMFFNPETLKLGPFLWFGNPPGEPLPDIRGFRTAKHTKADATGKKAERPGLRLIQKGKFEELTSIAQVVERLFGPNLKRTRGRQNTCPAVSLR
jgi:hypothetical protein